MGNLSEPSGWEHDLLESTQSVWIQVFACPFPDLSSREYLSHVLSLGFSSVEWVIMVHPDLDLSPISGTDWNLIPFNLNESSGRQGWETSPRGWLSLYSLSRAGQAISRYSSHCFWAQGLAWEKVSRYNKVTNLAPAKDDKFKGEPKTLSNQDQ